MPLRKIDGTKNQADLMTKHLDAKKAEGHLERMGLEFREGRAQAAANLYSIGSKDRATVEERVGKAALRGSSAPGKSEISKPKEMKMRWEDMRDGDEIGDEE